MSVSAHVPSPADAAALPTASEFVAEIKQRGGRVLRMREHHVFVITNEPETAGWLLGLGGLPYRPAHGQPSWDVPFGAYRRAREGPPEWDIYVHMIPVAGEQTIWEAAGKHGPTVDGVDYR